MPQNDLFCTIRSGTVLFLFLTGDGGVGQIPKKKQKISAQQKGWKQLGGCGPRGIKSSKCFLYILTRSSDLLQVRKNFPENSFKLAPPPPLRRTIPSQKNMASPLIVQPWAKLHRKSTHRGICDALSTGKYSHSIAHVRPAAETSCF